jgi:hypothetical protein
VIMCNKLLIVQKVEGRSPWRELCELPCRLLTPLALMGLMSYYRLCQVSTRGGSKLTPMITYQVVIFLPAGDLPFTIVFFVH